VATTYRRPVIRRLAALLAFGLVAVACSDDGGTTTTPAAAVAPVLTTPFFTTEHDAVAGPFDTVTLHIPLSGLVAGTALDIEVSGLGQRISTTESVAAGTTAVDITVPFGPGGDGWPGGDTPFAVSVSATLPDGTSAELADEAVLTVDLTAVAGILVGPAGAYRLHYPDTWEVAVETGFPESVVSNTESGLPAYRARLETLVFLSQVIPTGTPGVAVSVVTEGAVLTAPDLGTWVQLQLEGFQARGGTIAETSTVDMSHGPAVVVTGEIDGGALSILATRSGPRLYLVELVAVPDTPDAVIDEATAIVNSIEFFPAREPEPGPMAEVRTLEFSVSAEDVPALDIGFGVPATWGPDEVLEFDDGRAGIAIASTSETLAIIAESTGDDPLTPEAFAAFYLDDLAPGEEESRLATSVGGHDALVVVWTRDGRTLHDHFAVVGSWAVRIQVDVPAGTERTDLLEGILGGFVIADPSAEG